MYVVVLFGLLCTNTGTDHGFSMVSLGPLVFARDGITPVLKTQKDRPRVFRGRSSIHLIRQTIQECHHSHTVAGVPRFKEVAVVSGSNFVFVCPRNSFVKIAVFGHIFEGCHFIRFWTSGIAPEESYYRCTVAG